MSINNTCSLETSFALASLADTHGVASPSEQLESVAEVDQAYADLMETISEEFELVKRVMQDAYDLLSDILSALLPIARRHSSFTILQQQPCRQLIGFMRRLETGRIVLAELWNRHADFCEDLQAFVSNTSGNVETTVVAEVNAARRQGLHKVQTQLSRFEADVVKFDFMLDAFWEKWYGNAIEQNDTGKV